MGRLDDGRMRRFLGFMGRIQEQVLDKVENETVLWWTSGRSGGGEGEQGLDGLQLSLDVDEPT